MTDMLVRPLADNRMLRATGGPDLTTTLGQSLGAVFDTPMMTGLIGQSFAQAEAGRGFSDQQLIDLRQSEFDRQQEVSNLEAELDWSTDTRRDEITSRLGDLSTERNVQIQAETQRSIDEGRFQTPESLNEMYGELNLKFDRPMTSGEAKLLADNKRAEMIRQSIISKGPSGVLPTLAKFGAGLAAMAVDPLEVASMFIPVVGLAGRAAAVARFGKVGGRVLVGATEGFVGSALTEPIYFGLSRQQQLDYTMSDALLNVGLGTIFGGGIGAIGGVLARADAPAAAKVDGEPVRVDLPEAGRAVDIEPTRVDVSARAEVARVAPPVRVTQIDREAADTALRQFVNDQNVSVAARGVSEPEAPLQKFDSSFDTELELFHGTSEVFTEFDVNKSQGGGIWLTTDKAAIERGDVGAGTQGNIINARLKKDMKFADWDAYDKYSTDELIGQGYDGLKLDEGEGAYTYAIFDDKNLSIVDDAGRPISKGIADIPPPAQKDIASQLAKNAEINRMAGPEAARAYDEYVEQDFASESFISEDIQMYDAMVKQIDDLTLEQKVMVDEVAEIETRAKAYADVSRVAATCMART